MKDKQQQGNKGQGQGQDQGQNQGNWGQGNKGQGQGNYGQGSQGRGHEAQGYQSPDQGESRGLGNRDQDSGSDWQGPEATPRRREMGEATGDMSGQAGEGDQGRSRTGTSDMSGQVGRDRESSDR